MTSPEHAVLVTYALSDDRYGEESDRKAIYALQGRLRNAIEAAGAGEFDGNLFGGGEVELYAYGPDASRLFAAMEPELRAFPARPAHVVLRFGEADDPTAAKQRIDL
ncbi:hypothetical protein Ade02nite_31120 [Paractinoplanes deccanensis]|uniref:Uncharacterized protein n=1 Tax=Paractinoplanes deccanensis TaxID=113561 RepID=A0ABQ3Y393_9ACTN|nr:hypothetical protein [Actinoplanes deccanensis]GID74471.1 hypothetical protein Ade02nite_31120 [Actinoplanes deccanensis]